MNKDVRYINMEYYSAIKIKKIGILPFGTCMELEGTMQTKTNNI